MGSSLQIPFLFKLLAAGAKIDTNINSSNILHVLISTAFRYTYTSTSTQRPFSWGFWSAVQIKPCMLSISLWVIYNGDKNTTYCILRKFRDTFLSRVCLCCKIASSCCISCDDGLYNLEEIKRKDIKYILYFMHVSQKW